MYRPRHNDWTDREAIVAFCKAHPFAMFVTTDATELRPVVTHIPVIVRDNAGELTCTLHIARPNKQWQGIDKTEVLLVFMGPHAYIDPRGYEELDVPTWNYIAVHLYGIVRVISEPDDVRARLRLLVEQHGSAGLWKHLEGPLVEPLINGIVMMDVHITDVQGKRKMSQNRSDVDRAYGEQQVFPEGTTDTTRP
ncbi:MAG: FMN-binding negative transcriptional regulator [bacterium]|nr:FMN-binding negative transcriptional regulator [bacterium]